MDVYASYDVGQTSILSPALVPVKSASSFRVNVTHPTSVAGPSRTRSAPAMLLSSHQSTPSRRSLPAIDTSCSESQPLERVPTEPAPTCVEKPEQPSPETLRLKYGIKVRDFAYEANTLPPVPVVNRPPMSRELRRMREETKEERERRQELATRRFELMNARTLPAPVVKVEGTADDGLGGSHDQDVADSSAAEFQRMRSQFASGRSSLCPPEAMRRYIADISAQVERGMNAPQAQSQVRVQPQLRLDAPPLPSILAASQGDSEMDDEEYVKTPFVTPNGSLLFLPDEPVLDTSALQSSQISPLLSESQQPVTEAVSFSQMGLNLFEELAESQRAWQQESQPQEGQNHPMQVDKVNNLQSNEPQTTPRRSAVARGHQSSSPQLAHTMQRRVARVSLSSPTYASPTSTKRSIDSLSSIERASFRPLLFSPSKRRRYSRVDPTPASGSEPAIRKSPGRYSLRLAKDVDSMETPKTEQVASDSMQSRRLRSRSPMKAEASDGPRRPTHPKSMGKGKEKASLPTSPGEKHSVLSVTDCDIVALRRSMRSRR